MSPADKLHLSHTSVISSFSVTTAIELSSKPVLLTIFNSGSGLGTRHQIPPAPNPARCLLMP